MNRATVSTVSAIWWLALSVVFLFSLTVPANAQIEDETTAIPEVDARRERRQQAGGQGLMERLNLSPAQRQQIRAIRQQTNAEGRLITQRLRQARRALDEAIYLENADESVIETRAREVAAAQASGGRLRALTELRIRRVLTAEQLNMLREIRQQAVDRRQERRIRVDERRMRRGLNRRQRPGNAAPTVNEATPQPPAATTTTTPSRKQRDLPSRPRP